jgi:NADPH-dependent ferric siderophore reductase
MPKWVGDWLESAGGPRLKVTDVVGITPAIKKIRLSGDLSKMKFMVGGASVIRVSETAYRNYTIAAWDLVEKHLDIIVHVHGNGPGSRYMDSLKYGKELYISTPRGRMIYDPDVKRQFFFGDETSLGLAYALQSCYKINVQTFHFCFELDKANQSVPQLLGLENCSIFLKDGSFSDESWIKSLPVLKIDEWANANFVLTGNARSVQAFRNTLKNHRVSGKVFAQGYWLEGKKGM